MKFIEKNTVSTIERTEKNTAVLKLYKNRNVIFEKEYKTWKAAKTAETILLNKKYSYLFN